MVKTKPRTPTYELIKKLEALDFFSEIMTSGLIGMNWIDYKVIYEFYIKQLSVLNLSDQPSARKRSNVRRQAKTNTAEEFNISEVLVYKIIQKMTA